MENCLYVFKIILPVLTAVFKSWLMLSGYVGVFIATLISGEQSQAAMAKNIELYAFVKNGLKNAPDFYGMLPKSNSV